MTKFFNRAKARIPSVLATFAAFIIVYSLLGQYNLNNETHNLAVKNTSLAIQAKALVAQVDLERIVLAKETCRQSNQTRTAIRALVVEAIGKYPKDPIGAQRLLAYTRTNLANLKCDSLKVTGK